MGVDTRLDVRVRGAIAVLRKAWRNDGAEGESVHLVCDAYESAADEIDELRQARCADYERLQEIIRDKDAELSELRARLTEAEADRDAFDSDRIKLVEENEGLLTRLWNEFLRLTEAVMALEFYATMHEASSYYNGEVARKALAAIREGDGK